MYGQTQEGVHVSFAFNDELDHIKFYFASCTYPHFYTNIDFPFHWYKTNMEFEEVDHEKILCELTLVFAHHIEYALMEKNCSIN